MAPKHPISLPSLYRAKASPLSEPKSPVIIPPIQPNSYTTITAPVLYFKTALARLKSDSPLLRAIAKETLNTALK